jgi:hypothetical protein
VVEGRGRCDQLANIARLKVFIAGAADSPEGLDPPPRSVAWNAVGVVGESGIERRLEDRRDAIRCVLRAAAGIGIVGVVADEPGEPRLDLRLRFRPSTRWWPSAGTMRLSAIAR